MVLDIIVTVLMLVFLIGGISLVFISGKNGRDPFDYVLYMWKKMKKGKNNGD